MDKQTTHFQETDPGSCFARLGLFGVSAAEVPVPSRVPKESIYQAFGLGGQFVPVNDGSALLGVPVIAPHYSAMVASLEPENTIKMWDWLITQGYFSPLTNVESLTFPSNLDCSQDKLEWNQLKGSWNLALQTLGWGRYLAERDGKIPALWRAAEANSFLRSGYSLISAVQPSAGGQDPAPDGSLAVILEKASISCEGEPLYRWSLPGSYRYREGNDQDGYRYFSVQQTTRGQSPDDDGCPEMLWPGMAGILADPLAAGPVMKGISSCPFIDHVPYSEITISIIGMEDITTALGTFPALRVDATQTYRIQTMNHSDPSGIANVSEWHVCGVGLIRSMLVYKKSYQGRESQSQNEIDLLSFTPYP